MSLPCKILWSEGLTLGPQQLQQQDRYHEARLHRIASALNPHLWGLRGAQWNLDQLANNVLAADALSLIFPDGEIYEAPAPDALPDAVDLSVLPGNQQSFTFYAALPMLRQHGGNLLDPDAHRHVARHAKREADTRDLFTDAISVEVAYLTHQVYLLSDQDARNAYAQVPVARLRRLASGGFELDPGFMAPGLSIGALPALQLMLNSLLAKLSAKIAALYSLHRQPSKDVFEVQSGDLSSFWMLHTISTASASLSHFAQSGRQHPEALFETLLVLAGGLMTFSKRYAVADLPPYRHDAPALAFGQLDAMIRELVDTILSAKYFAIPLTHDAHRSTHYRGALDAAKLDQHSALCLAVNADMPALELVAAVPGRFKVGSPDDVERMIVSALPGLKLVHMAQVPGAIPVRPNTYYFSIDNKSAHYEAMLKAQAIALYVPAGMNGLKLELLALLP